MNQVKVMEVQSGQILFECSLDNIDSAYQYSAKMNEMGIDVKIVAPSVHETLGKALGKNSTEQDAYSQTLQEEHDSHDSCCIKDSEK
jgi:uncharacterized membrane protein